MLGDDESWPGATVLEKYRRRRRAEAHKERAKALERYRLLTEEKKGRTVPMKQVKCDGVTYQGTLNVAWMKFNRAVARGALETMPEGNPADYRQSLLENCGFRSMAPATETDVTNWNKDQAVEVIAAEPEK